MISKFGKLTVEMFKMPDYQMSKELKSLMKELKQKYSKVDEKFLSLFEKRHIIFIENGTDLGEIFSDDDKKVTTNEDANE